METVNTNGKETLGTPKVRKKVNPYLFYGVLVDPLGIRKLRRGILRSVM